MSEIITATPRDVSYILANLRQCDQRELDATCPPEGVPGMAHIITQVATFSYVAVVKGELGGRHPVATWGAWQLHPGVWIVWMLATDRWGQVARMVTKQAREALGPALYEVGANRVECLSIEGHHQAHRWLRYFGAHVEHEDPDTLQGGEICNWGINGETFYRFVWFRGDSFMQRYNKEENEDGEI
ncbi:hypothetical protein COB52_04990 [Candidatus Kaiserbacteria bacterium]|nr:MAG: hypothetical protein COB52_04990 [Candidatus Kaiserbacteria bacterium]